MLLHCIDMKINEMKSFNQVAVALLAAAWLLPLTVSAQIPGADKGTGTINAAMMKLFGANTNFIAKTEAHVYDKNHKETTALPMGFEMLAGNIRVEINLSLIKSKELSAEVASQMKQLGMDQLTTVQLIDKKVNLQIYPGLKSYVELAMTKEEADALAKDYKIEKTPLGKETVDGHSCEKVDVTFTDDKGVKQTARVWNAKDLKDFPVQIEATEDDSTLILHFKDIKLGRPEASHFTTPAGMKKFETVEGLMTDAATKKLGGLLQSK